MKRFLSTSSGLSTKSFDVVIAGGGLVGASVALGLATDKLAAPLSVAIVDTSLPPAKEEVREGTLSCRKTRLNADTAEGGFRFLLSSRSMTSLLYELLPSP